MKVDKESISLADLKEILGKETHRIGHFTSLDGGQLLALLLDPSQGDKGVKLYEIALENGINSYPSLTIKHPQLHWFERALFDMFGIIPSGHPRLKHLYLHEPYERNFFPLRRVPLPENFNSPIDRRFHFLEVKGEGIYELPVGPIHAGVIEPGHFRFSCLGETIINLEIQLGYLHRGVEKRLTEVPLKHMHFLAEAVASDTSTANALAHAEAIESLAEIEVSERSKYLRSIALEIERLAMHIVDVGGMSTDIGLLGIASAMGRLRGTALGMGDLLTGSRFLRGFIVPGGVRLPVNNGLFKLKGQVARLRHELKEPIAMFLDNQMALERMREVGVLKASLAKEFGMVGPAGRASGQDYDVRRAFSHAAYPNMAPPTVTAREGDILAREMVRIKEIWSTLDTIDRLLDNLPEGETTGADFSKVRLKPDSFAVGIVEAFRGELLHLVATDKEGKVARYAVKHPSFNNWTALAIAIRNNLIADFPLCNKSFSLSYSGNDL